MAKIYFKSTGMKTLRTDSSITYVGKIVFDRDGQHFSVRCEIFPKNLIELLELNRGDYFEASRLDEVMSAFKKDGFLECNEEQYKSLEKKMNKQQFNPVRYIRTELEKETQIEFAERINRKVSQISDWETGHRNVSHKTLTEICRLLGIIYDARKEGADQLRKAEDLCWLEVSITENQIKIESSLDDLSETKEMIENIIKTMNIQKPLKSHSGYWVFEK